MKKAYGDRTAQTIMRRLAAVVCAAILWDMAFVWWMGDGLAGLKGDRRAAAEQVIAHARMFCLDKPLPTFLTRSLHVRVAQEKRTGCQARYPYDVELTVHTFLGLPLMPISSKACAGVWCTIPLAERE